MFFITPIAHEEGTSRRWPIVSTLLVVACVAVFIVQLSLSKQEDAAMTAVDRAADHIEAHPYLAARCHALSQHTPRKAPPQLSADDIAADQAKADALCAEADRLLFKLPTHRFGDMPGRPKLYTLFTHQFLHGGWLHLIFNMWFLWLAACNLEDRWGRPIFLAFYLLSGVAAALLDRVMTPGSLIPGIGASGAIAGAMGAFLVILARTKIRFFYAFWFLVRGRVGTFDAPAYVMLPLWFLVEVFDGLASPGDGVSHWAHVGGFAFGAAVAGIFKVTKLDDKLNDAVDKKASTMQDSRILDASRALDEGRVDEGIAMLERIAFEQPSNTDVRIELLRAAALKNDLPLRARTLVDLAIAYLDAGEMRPAVDMTTELHQLQAYDLAPPERVVRLGERLAQKGNIASASQVLQALYRPGLKSDVTVRAAVAHAAVLFRAGQPEVARPILESAYASTFATPETRSKIEAMIQQLDSRVAASVRAM